MSLSLGNRPLSLLRTSLAPSRSWMLAACEIDRRRRMHGMAGAKRMPETEQATGTLSGADAESLTETARMADRNRLLSVLLHVSNLTGHDADVRTLAEAVLERLHGLLFCDGSLCYVQEGNRLVNLAQKGPIRDIVGKHPIMNQLLPIGQTFLNRRQPLILSLIHISEP